MQRLFAIDASAGFVGLDATFTVGSNRLSPADAGSNTIRMADRNHVRFNSGKCVSGFYQKDEIAKLALLNDALANDSIQGLRNVATSVFQLRFRLTYRAIR